MKLLLIKPIVVILILAFTEVTQAQVLIEGEQNGTVNIISMSGVVTPLASTFGQIGGLAFDSSGTLFASLGSVSEIDKITIQGSLTPFITSGLNASEGLVFDSSGNLFEVDQGTASINKITTGGIISTFATGLTVPFGIANDGFDNLYVSNQGGSGIIDKITPGGVVSVFATIAGNPTGLVFDSSGNLFVSDSASNVIDKITPGGVITTYASGFNSPLGLAFDSNGNLYEADLGTNSIFKIAPDGTVTSFVTGLSSFPLSLDFTTVPEPSAIALLLAVSLVGWSRAGLCRSCRKR